MSAETVHHLPFGLRSDGRITDCGENGKAACGWEHVTCVECLKHANQKYREMLAELSRLEAENERLREERDSIAEELASNRACNLYTWKEQFQSAESKLSALIASVREIAEKARKWQTPKGPCAEFVDDPGWNECKECGFDHAEHVVQRMADALQQAIGDTQ